MSTIRRKWGEAQKLQVIQEVEQNGLIETLRKYNLSQSLFHKWRKAYNGEGMQGLKPKYKTIDPVRSIEKKFLELDF